MVRILTDTADFFKYLCGVFEECTLDIINNEVAITCVNKINNMTEHVKSNVYIYAFITGYSRLKLCELLEKLQQQMLYYDTDSIVYVYSTGKHLITPDTTGNLGKWTFLENFLTQASEVSC